MNKNPHPLGSDLRELLELPVPILSVYLGGVSPANDDVPARRHAAIALLTAHGASDEALKIVESVFAGMAPGRSASALFVGVDGAHREFRLPGAEVGDLVLRADVPHLTPLLAWRQARPAFVVALVDRTGADITVHPRHGGVPTTSNIAGPDDEIERNAPGGWSQPRYQQRAEDSWQHNARRAAEEVAAALDGCGARILLLGGDVRAVQYFTEDLPAWVHQDVTIAKVRGSRTSDGSWQRRALQIAEEVARAVDARTGELLTEMRDHGGPNGRGVQRASAVLKALSQGRVATLLVTDEPDDRRTAWFGAGPTDIAVHRTELAHAEFLPRRGPLTDVAVRAAILTDADVRVLRPDTPDTPASGIGAICRF